MVGPDLSVGLPCLNFAVAGFVVEMERICSAGHCVLQLLGQKNRVGHSVGWAEQPRAGGLALHDRDSL